jgi:hypothetical protein
MTPAELRALAKRVCEEQPSQELDCEVAFAVGWRLKTVDSVGYWRRGDFSWTAEMEGIPPAFLTSLDAAASLMPEGCGLEVRRYWLSKSISHAYDQIKHGPGDGVAWSVVASWGIAGECAVIEDCPTEPQARVAAALLALAADTEARDV